MINTGLGTSLRGHNLLKVQGTSAQGGITRGQIYLLPETTKTLDKIYETIVFNALDIRQQKTVIPERWEEMRGAGQSLLLLPRSFQALVQGVEIQAEPT